MILDSSSFLKELKNKDPHTGLLIESLIDQLNTIGQHLGVTMQGKTEPPPPIQSVSVAAGADFAHVTVLHTQPVNKGVRYFLEHSVDGGASWHVHPEQSSREWFLKLPTKNGGGATYNYIFRAYTQYLGSDPSAPTYFGSKNSPTQVNLTGTMQTTLLAATGSGTAAPDGTQGGHGLGTWLTRPAIGAKKISVAA